MKKILASATITATVISGGLLAGAAIAAAQDDKPSWLDEVLTPLVDDGTLTPSQADAVETAIQEARPMDGPRGGRGGLPGHVLEDLGLDPTVVREGLQSGMTLGEIAEANGISADDVVQALIDEQAEHLAQAVEAGRIDADTAAEREAAFAERAQGMVDGTLELGEMRGFGPRGHQHGPFGDHHDEADTTTDSGSGA